MEIVLILSQEHQTLPKAEVEAVLNAESIPFSFENQYEGVLILNVPDEYSKSLKTFGKRLSYTHEVCKLLIETDKVHLNSEIQTYPWKDIIIKDFAVRVKRMDKDDKFDTTDVEWEIGGLINNNIEGAKVNLKDPSSFLRLIYINGKIFVTERLFKIEKKHFYNLKPHKRPFFYPGSMSPKLARCMVNLTGVKKGDLVLDPFCGTGGILLEAGIMGAKVIGVDIDEKMVNGTIKNLNYCGVKDYQVFQGDARKICLHNKVKAIATDPPYGISASTGGEESQNLYAEALVTMAEILTDTGRLCMATPHYMDIEELIQGTNFEIIEQHHIRMHKSLTRVISILKKSLKEER
ncbi:TIGR01177 family methyltransferase [Methanobacterium spitsbergense]|uniref:tRNA (guanine(10)-N(2))-dimethyltransferase n=1 Tax=Methanobacterium spitsbergense TaxID=2874285 RepID=A0A8T5V0D7_9EURY|nr:TIGR01177 family methyltransferase [Methanobacterium spitsbergense]MBZ2165321.1 TIGR01177 family methyltransferase [Methanobacterium spitsbergense]